MSAPGRLPDFAIIGAMKAGTSSLHEQLKLRDGLFLSDPKEPNFFSDDPQYARGLGWYRGLFADARPDQLCGESSTHYTKLPTHPRTVERMQTVLPDARFVYVMRHPVERLVSQYIHEWTQRTVRGSIDQAVEAEERFVAYSCYHRQLEPYLEAYGPERVLLVCFERLVAQPDAELDRICAFVGDPTPTAPRWESELGEQNVSRERLRVSPLRDALLRQPALRALKNRLPQGWRDAAKGLWRIRRRPALSSSVAERVEQRLDADLFELGLRVGADLSCGSWKQCASRGPLEWAAARASEAR